MIKGVMLKSRLKYVRTKYGEDALKNLLDSLDPDLKATLTGRIIATQWYPFQTINDLDSTICEQLARGRDKAYLEMGAFSADNQFTTAYRGYLQSGNPHTILKKSSTMFSRFYKPGSMDYLSTGEKSCLLVIKNFISTTQNCLTAVGFFKRAIELSGGKKVKIEEVKCTARGDDVCEFQVTWS
jgi:uncharacterized protein (TIGR02265 family)